VSFVEIDPLFGDRGTAMVELCERFGPYGMYSQQHVESEIGRGLTQRHDAVLNHLKTGGRRRRDEPVAQLAARTNYFREEYAYGTKPLIDGIEPFLFHEGFVDAAQAVHGRPVIEPAIVFANLMVPGQELAIHTDVPEFRGANRKLHPQWLLVAMRHSEVFEEFRMPIATGVAWFHDADGGEFAFWPEGASAPPVSRKVMTDTALVLDTDSVFHGVDPVAAPRDEIAPLTPGMTLAGAGGGRWQVRDGDDVVAEYRWDDLRFSVSWKAYCFTDDAEREAWRAHTEDLDLDWILARLADDLRERGRIDGETPEPRDLALLIIDEYIRFPVPTPGDGASRAGTPGRGSSTAP
jgi:hypothetical protein